MEWPGVNKVDKQSFTKSLSFEQNLKEVRKGSYGCICRRKFQVEWTAAETAITQEFCCVEETAEAWIAGASDWGGD